MKILVVGAGLSGCTIARTLHDRFHDVQIIEKKDRIGGLCVTDVDENGLKYEPYGARTFHCKDQETIDFVTRFDPFNGYTHRKGMIIKNQLYPYPITRKAIEKFSEEREQIFDELDNRPKKINKSNFETACISIFGKTLYGYFIENYTRKMWGTDPKNLTSEWAPKRLELRETEEDGLFLNQWQGLPKAGYSVFLEKMIEGIPLKLNTVKYDNMDYDLVISSAPIDELLDFKYGKLAYRSFDFDYKKDEPWEHPLYGTINLPDHDEYVRKCNFKILHKQDSEHNIIQYQKPVALDDNHMPMYPVSTKENGRLAKKYLKKACKLRNILPIGRLGLYKYLDMNTAVASSIQFADLAERYLELDSLSKYLSIKNIINQY